MRTRYLVLAFTAGALAIFSPMGRGASTIASASTQASWDSAWPMHGHDAQRSNRSPANGPTQPHLLWTLNKFRLVAVDSSGGVYGITPGPAICAFDSSGNFRWIYSHFLGDSALLPDGSLFSIGFDLTNPPAGSLDAEAVSIGLSGKLDWKIQPFGLTKGQTPVVGSDAIFAPIVGPHDGTAASRYIGLNFISGSGAIVRRVAAGHSFGNLALSESGVAYGSLGNNTLAAFGQDGKRLWKHNLDYTGSLQEILVGKSGTLYMAYGKGGLVARNSSGKRLWRHRLVGGVLNLAERTDGSLLVAGNGRLTALTASGRALWHISVAKFTASSTPGLATDLAGKAYVATPKGLLLVVSASGKVLQRLRIGVPAKESRPTVMLGPDGRLLVSGTDDALRVYDQGG